MSSKRAGDTHTMICVLMMNDRLTLQQAVDRLGEMCKQRIDRFVENLTRVPLWRDHIDRDVKLYVDGYRRHGCRISIYTFMIFCRSLRKINQCVMTLLAFAFLAVTGA